MNLNLFTLLIIGYLKASALFEETNLKPFYLADKEPIDSNYIIVMDHSISNQAMRTHFETLNFFIMKQSSSGKNNSSAPRNKIKHKYYMNNFKGYSGSFDSEFIKMIRASPEIAHVEQDSVMRASNTELNAPWGLARVSHRKSLGFGDFNKYLYSKDAGNCTIAYVIDTGVNIKHVDFDGRATWGATIPVGDEDLDGNGHGSHCAGTIAGRTYGVSKNANVVAVKVLRSNGSGSTSDVIKGIEWAAKNSQKVKAEAEKQKKCHKGSVANMSLGGGYSRAMNMVVDSAVDMGLSMAVAAGNDNRDACNYSPASSKNAVTVGATSLFDERAWFSNFGKCVDIFAPGQNIKSIWNGNDHAINTISGTSMASPHIAGLMAYVISTTKTQGIMTPEQVKEQLIKLSTRKVIHDIGEGSPDLLAFNGYSNDQ